LELKQELKQFQQLNLTPQLLQSIKYLQLTTVELSEEIKKELIENPFLEEAPLKVKKEPEKKAEKKGEEYTFDHNSKSSSFSGYKTRNTDYDDLFGSNNNITRKQTLKEHLLWQSKMTFDFEIDKKIAQLIIENINGDGFLDSQNEDKENTDVLSFIQNEINKEYRNSEDEDNTIDIDDIREVLTTIQLFDPIGCGTTNKIEALIVQAKYYKFDDNIIDIIENHFEDLANRKVNFFKEKYNLAATDVVKIIEIIKTLEPIPGRNFFHDEPEYIEPDLYLEKDEKGYRMRSNHELIPELIVNKPYKDAYLSSNDEKTKEFAKEKCQAAENVINAIEQRKKTIKEVMKAILHFQRDFFDRGIAHLKPLKLKDVADYIGKDESTVSRVTSNKYVLTDRGLFSLKYFFSTAVTVTGGDSISSKSVKDVIKKLLESEDSSRPMSDDKIAEILNKKYGINITRRTVANYRMELGILSSTKRKNFV